MFGMGTGFFFSQSHQASEEQLKQADIFRSLTDVITDTVNESVEAYRAISTGKLHVSPHFHTRPINVVVFHGSQGKPRFEVGFSLRCFQRLSIPHLATLLRGWRHDRSTRGVSIPVLSY